MDATCSETKVVLTGDEVDIPKLLTEDVRSSENVVFVDKHHAYVFRGIYLRMY